MNIQRQNDMNILTQMRINSLASCIRCLFVVVIFIANIFSLKAMENTIMLEIYTEQKSQSLESYHRRIEKLQTIVNSFDNIKKAKVSQWGYVIGITGMQKISCNEKPLKYANNLARAIEQKMLPEKIQAKVIFYPDNSILLNWTATVTQGKQWKHLEY